MKKQVLTQIGPIRAEYIPANTTGFIGGVVIVTNEDTGEIKKSFYKINHKGKSDLWEVATKLMAELTPKEKDNESTETTDT